MTQEKYNVIQEFQSLLGQQYVLENLSERYVHIWKMNEGLKAKCLLLPSTTEEISQILILCNKHKIPVVVHGGLTNLVGSTETSKDDVVISLERMNHILELDEQSRTITVEAGVILESIHEKTKEKDLLFPLNFGAKGSAVIGGILSTNAGGLRVFKYGMTRDQVLGLEAVLADGTIVSSIKKVLKDNSAYDIKQLFIGSEGTLGIITKAVLRLREAPQSRVSAFIAFDEYPKVVEFLKYIDKQLGGMLSGYELIWGTTYELMTSQTDGPSPVLPHGYKYYVLVEGLGSDQGKDQKQLQDVLEQALQVDMIKDAVLAHTQSDLDWFWRIREDVRVVAAECQNDHHFDISLPIPKIGEYVDNTVEKLKSINGVHKVFPFGHVADGNIHFIIGKENDSPQLKKEIDLVVYEPLKQMGGSVSAEHGIGLDKKAYLHLCRSEQEISVMKRLKNTFDPNRILNRGKVLD